MVPVSQERVPLVKYNFLRGYCQDFSQMETICGWQSVEAGMSADFTKMENEHYWLVIKFLLLESKSRNEVKERSDGLYGDSFSLNVDRQKLVWRG